MSLWLYLHICVKQFSFGWNVVSSDIQRHRWQNVNFSALGMRAFALNDNIPLHLEIRPQRTSALGGMLRDVVLCM